MHASQQLSDVENHKRGTWRHESLQQIRPQFDTGIAALLRPGEPPSLGGCTRARQLLNSGCPADCFDKTAPRDKNMDDSVHDPSSLGVSGHHSQTFAQRNAQQDLDTFWVY